MIKDIFVSSFVVFIVFVGFILTLMQMYASPDAQSYPFNGSLIYLGLAIFVFMFLYTLKSDISKVIKLINILIIIFVAVLGILLSLICLYASPVPFKVFPLASSIFTLSSMIAFSAIFFLGRCTQVNTTMDKEVLTDY